MQNGQKSASHKIFGTPRWDPLPRWKVRFDPLQWLLASQHVATFDNVVYLETPSCRIESLWMSRSFPCLSWFTGFPIMFLRTACTSQIFTGPCWKASQGPWPLPAWPWFVSPSIGGGKVGIGWNG
jgi:hypothetical protein